LTRGYHSLHKLPYFANAFFGLMEKKSITIIGAGLAGLSAGCYGLMNGYDVQIFEHDIVV
ncbi:MAG: NAD(P)-binding protein, partial [bacterium]